MSEKLYASLLRLFPSAFRGRYEEEALQLLRDRLSNERGFFLRLRLYLDLITDTIGALPRAYRNSYTDAAAPALLTPHSSGVPSFRGLQKEPIRREVIMMAVLLTIAVLATFSYVIVRPYRPMDQNGPKSPIEAVLQRLNQSTSGSLDSSSVPLYTIGGNIHPPIPLNVVNPVFPKSAHDIEEPFPKIVIVSLIVDASGKSHDVHVVHSYRPDFDAQAVKAVEQDRFAPAENAGKPVAVALKIVVNFWKDGEQPAGPPPPAPELR